MPSKLTQEDIEAKVEAKRVTYISHVGDSCSTIKITFLCQCGNEETLKYKPNFTNKDKIIQCNECRIGKPDITEEIRIGIAAGCTNIAARREKQSNRTRIIISFICKCGNAFEKPNNHFMNAPNCSNCTQDKKRVNQMKDNRILETLRKNNCEFVASEHIGGSRQERAENNITYKCGICGNETTKEWQNIREGRVECANCLLELRKERNDE